MISASKKEHIVHFHNYAEEFLIAMIEAFSTNKKLKSYNNKYQISKQANQFQAIKMFYHHISPYKEHILKSNIDVFLNIELDASSDDDNIIEALQLKEMWKTLKKKEQIETAETIFKYLKLLLFFVEKCYE